MLTPRGLDRDVCDEVADRELIRRLRQSGFSMLLDLIEGDDSVFTASGKLSVQKIAARTGSDRQTVEAVLRDVQRLCRGEIKFTCPDRQRSTSFREPGRRRPEDDAESFECRSPQSPSRVPPIKSPS